jgi:hypothetical protein
MPGAVRKEAADLTMEDSKPSKWQTITIIVCVSIAYINLSQGIAERTEILSMMETGYEAQSERLCGLGTTLCLLVFV